MPPPTKQGNFASKVEQTLGIIPGTKLWSPFPFSGLNLQDTPPAIDDKEFSYLENWFRLGNGYLRTGYDAGAPFFTATNQTILPYFFWYNIGSIDYVSVFFTDGTAVQIQQSTGAITPITTIANTFYRLGGTLPMCSQSGTQYLLISNNNTANDYWIWDGSVLYTAGTVGPIVNITSGGQNYNTLPTVIAYGGQGSGIVVTPTIFNGSVVTVAVNDPGMGYAPGDTVQLQFTGGGSDNGAILEAVLGSGSVSAANVTAGGSGYTSATATFDPPSGTTATGTAVVQYAGVLSYISKVIISNGGSGYSSPPTVTISGGGGSGAAATANISGGVVVSVTITNGGLGYTSTPTVAFSAPSGTTATGTVTIAAGAVTDITITDGGSGYTSVPNIVIAGDGTAATAVAILSSGGISGITVVDGGTNYTFPPPLSFIGGGGFGAAATAKLTPTSVAFINVTSGGLGYTSAPTVVINNTGTSGTGCKATAVIDQGQVIAIVVTNGGSGYELPPYVTFSGGGLPTGAPAATAQAILTGTSIASVIVGNQGQNYTQTPAVVIEPGSNNAAYAIMEMMPYGVSGSAIETFNSRVWLTYPYQKTSIPTGGNLLVTAPESLTDFATSDGGVLFVNSDRFLRKQYTGLRQSNGYLYCFGDSSTNVISNVSTSGNPATTTFNYQNVDPQTGMAWRDTCQDFSRTIIFGNELGIYGLYGGSATKISAKLDRLFNTAVYPPDSRALTPSAAVSTMFNIKHYLFLFTIEDPETGVVRNVMACWNEKEWSIVSQTPNLIFIGTQEVNGQPLAWGTDGQSIYQLFVQPSATLPKRLTTKVYGTDQLFILKDFLNLYLQAQDLSGGSGIDMNVTMIASGVAVQDITSPSVASSTFSSGSYPAMLFSQPSFNATPPYWPVFGTGTGGFSFDTLAASFTTTSPDFAIANLVLAYLDATAYQ